MAYVGKNPKFDSTILKDEGISAVANPAASSNKIVNRNGDLVVRDSSGNESSQKPRSVADITAIKGIVATERFDGDLVFDETTLVLYVFDADSVVAGDDDFVLQPTAGTGRWLKVAPNAGSAIDLTTDVTGSLPIANGGTGQTTQTEAFDALSPTTTKGDLIASNGTDNIRVAIGTDGQFLKADSAVASGVSWDSPGNTLTQNLLGDAGYTILDGDGFDVIVVGQSAVLTADRTVTLPTAADNSGRRITVIKADTSAFDVIIDGEGAEVVAPGGATTITLSYEGLGATLICDGSEWRFLSVHPEATEDYEGVVRKNKFQGKENGSAVTASGTITALTFNNLVVGKKYRVGFRGFMGSSAPAATTINVAVAINHNAVQIGLAQIVFQSVDADRLAVHVTASEIFKATATTVTFDATISGTNAYIAVLSRSYIEELNNYVDETTDFT